MRLDQRGIVKMGVARQYRIDNSGRPPFRGRGVK
jgi:hypothetical protein